MVFSAIIASLPRGIKRLYFGRKCDRIEPPKRKELIFMKKTGVTRQSNIELLRILTMLGVILLHYNGEPGGALDAAVPGSLNFYILHIVESMFICAVNLFVLISGYFLCTGGKRSAWKAFELLIQVVVYSAGLYVLQSILSGGFSLRSFAARLLPANYFVTLYVAVYLISPYLNLLIRGLTGKGNTFRTCLILLGVVFAVYSTAIDLAGDVLGTSWSGLSTVALDGTQRGYSVVNFAMMYLIGAYLRLEKTEKQPVGKLLLAFFANSLVLAAIAAGGKLAGINVSQTMWAYCNPLVMINAVLIFQVFRALELPELRWVNLLASGAFSVYLLHAAFLGYCRIGWAVTKNSVVLLAHMVVTAVAIYLICWCAHMVYTWITAPIFRALRKKFPLMLPEIPE